MTAIANDTPQTDADRQTLLVPALGQVYSAIADLAQAGLRIAAGAFLIPHGMQKLFGSFGGYGLEATGQFFQAELGFANGWLAALGAGTVETFGGLLLALGLLTRPAALAIAVLLIVAATAHVPAGFFWTAGGWEYPVLWAVIALYFVASGGGRYSLDRLIGREV